MARLTFSSLVSLLFLFAAAHSFSAPPEVPTAPPYIALSDNLDEPNGYGFCLDTFGNGYAELMHSHSCKPAMPEGTAKDDPSHDVRWSYDIDTQKVSSYAFDGLCMQVLVSPGTSAFGMLSCSEAPHQHFVYQSDDQTLRLSRDTSKCVAVDSETLPAGPWFRRVLTLANCDDTEANLKQWTIVAE